MIRLHRVSKIFSGDNGTEIAALDNIDLTVAQGEFVTVIGPSGSGKSTLLFTIGGLLQPTFGTVEFEGNDVYDLTPSARAALRRSKIGFVFQTFNLVPYLSCEENVALPAVLSGVARRDAEAQARDKLTHLGMGARLTHRPSALSVGERQRVAMARSLINGPGVLLADEPTGNLDPEMTNLVTDLLRSLNADGQTIILVTHDPDLARLGDRRLQLLGGVIVVEDRHRDVVEASA
jgi:putative ABC transport system ATP-binding protein